MDDLVKMEDVLNHSTAELSDLAKKAMDRILYRCFSEQRREDYILHRIAQFLSFDASVSAM